MIRTWHLAETNYHHVKHAPPPEVAVLPFGATEPHNLHLPYGTDTLQVDALADEACTLAQDRGASVIRLPTIPFGTETNQQGFPLSMNLNPTTLLAVLRDLLEPLARHGTRKLLLLNGHGGNDFKWMLRELHGQTGVHLFLCNWYRLATDVYDELFDDAGDHAGEMETSLVLAHAPHLVQLDLADDGAVASTKLDTVNKGWVEITRPWHLLTTNTGAGNPHPATAEKGRRLTDIVADRLAQFLVEASALKVDEKFPY